MGGADPDAMLLQPGCAHGHQQRRDGLYAGVQITQASRDQFSAGQSFPFTHVVIIEGGGPRAGCLPGSLLCFVLPQRGLDLELDARLPISAVAFVGSPETPESAGPPHGLI